MEAFNRVTQLAVIEIGRLVKLTCVNVTMAIEAAGFRDFEESLLAGRQMTFCACDLDMHSFERIFRSRMFLDAECGRYKSIHSVAEVAFAAVRAAEELTSMRIGMVTVRALLKS